MRRRPGSWRRGDVGLFRRPRSDKRAAFAICNGDTSGGRASACPITQPFSSKTCAAMFFKCWVTANLKVPAEHGSAPVGCIDAESLAVVVPVVERRARDACGAGVRYLRSAKR